MAAATPNPPLDQLLALSSGDPGNRYWPYDTLGKGTFGEVIKAVDSNTNNNRHGDTVAIKIMKDDILMTKTSWIIREVENHKLCNHPNIVRFYGLHDFSNTVWMVMECVRGMDVRRLVLRTILKPPEIAYITQQVLHALDYLHTGLNLLHRDIRPHNILINHEGDVKIADFGLSIKNSEKKTIGVGAQSYLAPEMLRSHYYSYPVDIWAVGITIYVLAERKLPYTDKPRTRNEKYLLIRENKHTPLLTEYHPQNMRSFVFHCLKEECRPSAKKLLTHPWIATSCTRNDMAKLINVATNGQHIYPFANHLEYYAGITLPSSTGR